MSGMGLCNNCIRRLTVTLNDGESFNSPAGKSLWLLISNTAAWGFIHIASDGSVASGNISDSVSLNDTPGKLCVFDDGDHAQIKNRLGEPITFTYILMVSD